MLILVVLFLIIYSHSQQKNNKTKLPTLCIGNQMISSAIWDKSARVNFSKTNKIVRARRASAICSLLKIYECGFIPNCTRKSYDYLLIIHIQIKVYAASRCQTYRRFRTLTFHSLLKHYGVPGVYESRYCF